MNDAGTYICTDSKATKTLSPEAANSYDESGEQNPSRENAIKAVPIGKNIYATIGGNKAWAIPIIESLKSEVIKHLSNFCYFFISIYGVH